MTTSELLDARDSLLYLSLLLADQPRRIDAVIDYFGDTSSDSVVAEPASTVRAEDF